MKTKHTPGTWRREIVHYRGEVHHAVTLPDGRIAAFCGIVGAPDDIESRCNAALIAAAPDLLNALHWLMFADDSPAYDKAVEDARRAIAKATGSKA